MTDSALLLQPEVLSELRRYRALEQRLQTSHQQSQAFKELAKQVAPANTLPLATPLRDGSPAAELDAALSALREQIEKIYQIEAELNEQVRAAHESADKASASLSSQLQPLLIWKNIKIALYVIGSIVLFLLLLILFHSVTH